MGLFKPATRHKLRLRMAIDGPSGSGKTFTGLRFGNALAAHEKRRIAVISTESGAVEKYLGLTPDGEPWAFDVAYLPDFAPTSYTSAILAAGREGYDVLLVDSLSHAWEGEGGALELVDKKGGNRYTAWKDVTPMHRRMVEALLRSPCHVICTMRSKTAHVLEADKDGKQVPRKIGMEPIQRPGMEYEFDVYASMDWTHTLAVSKTRCPDIDGQIVVKPGAAWIEPLVRWLNEGSEAPAGFYTATEADIERSVAAREAEERSIDKSPKKPTVSGKAAIAEAAAKSKSVASSSAAAAPPSSPSQASAEKPAGDSAQDPPFDLDPKAPGSITREQVKRLEKYFDLLEVPPAAREAALKKRGANAIRNLSSEAADELIAKLMEKELGFDNVKQPAKAAAEKN